MSPSPDHIALDDGVKLADGVTPAKGLNQYTIDVGIPTSITANIEGEWLRTHSSWNLTGTAPALRPLLPNYKVESYGSATVGPQHPSLETSTAPNPTPTPEHGLKFDVQTSASPSSASNVGWNFPDNNDKFGLKTLNHVVGGATVPAPVALFFPNSGFQHPDGGPIGYSRLYGATVVGEKTPTPNWFYYYDQLFKNPWNVEIHYLRGTGSTSYGLSGAIFIGDEAHGKMTKPFAGSPYSRPTYTFARLPSSNLGEDPGPLECVGEEFVRGIDVYARTVTHESCHVLMRQIIHDRSFDANHALIDVDGNGRPDVDNDGDRCPDDVERAVGLNPKSPNTTNWGGYYGTSGHADGEVVATMYEKGLLAPTDQDWADDGLNHGVVPIPNRNQRILSVTSLYDDTVTLIYPNPHTALNPMIPARYKPVTP